MTDAERRKRTEEELFLLFSLLTRDTRATLQEHVLAYLAGTVSLWSLSDALVTALSESHSHAAYLGRRLAGHRQPFGRNDQDFGASVMIEQMRYLEPFLTDLQAGRYAAGEGQLVNRLSAYAQVLRGTSNEAWGLNLPGDTMVDWVLGPLEHCTPQPGFPYDCVALAADGPYPARSMPTWPGMCQTPCLFNCGCMGRTQDGRSGFPLVAD